MNKIIPFLVSIVFLAKLSTKAEETCPIPTKITIVDITSNSAKIVWSGAGPIFQMVISVNKSIPPEDSDNIQSSSNTYDAKSLDPNKEYFVYIRTVCELQKSLWSEPVSFATKNVEIIENISDSKYTLPPSIQLGLGFGPNISGKNYEYYISPLKNTLERDYLSDIVFVGSVVLSYTPKFNYVKTRSRYVDKVENGNNVRVKETEIIEGSDFKAPGWFSILGSFNMGEFTTSLGFNSRLSGGLGVGINIENTLQIGMFCDFTQVRQLRSTYTDSIGKSIIINNIPLTNLDINDNRFFKTTSKPSFSIKLIYLLSRRKTDVQTGLGKGENIE